jgi:hypothetical protein
MAQFHPSYFRKIITFGIEEKIVEETDGCLNRRRISRTKSFVNVNQGPFGFLLAEGFAGFENV